MAYFLAVFTVFCVWADDLPFWRNKPQLLPRIREQKEILVSSKKIGSKAFKMSGVGVVAAPLEFTYKITTDFNEIKKASAIIKELKYDKDKEQLFFRVAAIKIQFSVRAQLKFVRGEGFAEIHWQNIEGDFKNMYGKIRYEELKDGQRRRTEMSVFGTYESEQIPEFLGNFIFEVTLQKLATGVRHYVEDRDEAQNKLSVSTKN